MMLSDVLADELVLRDAMQRGSQLSDGVPKARVAHGDVPLISRPTQIDPKRFAQEPTSKPWRDRRGSVEVPTIRIPAKLSVRENDENAVVGSVCAPPANFLVDPVRGRCLWRGQQHEVARLGERHL